MKFISSSMIDMLTEDEALLNTVLSCFSGVVGRGSDYIVIGLDSSHVVFRFDLGSGV